MPYIPTCGISPGITTVPSRDPSTRAFDCQPGQAGASNIPLLSLSKREKCLQDSSVDEGGGSSAGVGGESLVGAAPWPRVTAIPCHIPPRAAVTERGPPKVSAVACHPVLPHSSAQCCPLSCHSCLSLAAPSPKLPLSPCWVSALLDGMGMGWG